MTMRELREARGADGQTTDAEARADARPDARADDPTADSRARPGRPTPSLLLTAVRTVPWSVLVGYPVFFGTQAMAAGAILFALLMVPWVSLVGLSRRWQQRFATRRGRVGVTLAVLTVAVVLLGFGGIVVVPAIGAFLALDLADPGTAGARLRATLLFGALVLTAALTAGALTFFVFPAALTALLAVVVPVRDVGPVAAPAGRDRPSSG